jgi:hypothetical protein
MNQLNGQGRPRRSFRIKRSRKKTLPTVFSITILISFILPYRIKLEHGSMIPVFRALGTCYIFSVRHK